MRMRRKLSRARQETLPVWEGFLPIRRTSFERQREPDSNQQTRGYEPGMHANASPAIFTSLKTGLKVLKIRRNTQIEYSFADKNEKPQERL